MDTVSGLARHCISGCWRVRDVLQPEHVTVRDALTGYPTTGTNADNVPQLSPLIDRPDNRSAINIAILRQGIEVRPGDEIAAINVVREHHQNDLVGVV